MSSVREDLRLIYETCVEAVKPNSLIKNYIEFKDNQLLVKNFTASVDKKIPLKNRDIFVFGAGKAVLKMCEEFVSQFQTFVTTVNDCDCSLKGGLLSVPTGANTDSPLLSQYGVEVRPGALNNMPDDNSMRTTQRIVQMIASIKSGNNNGPKKVPLIVWFISGGGSALLTLPKPGLTLDRKCHLISRLVKSGATINELNGVRQCLSEVKSGKLAKLAVKEPNPLETITFLISDIIGDPIDLIASGPTVLPEVGPTKSSEKAFDILKKLNIEVMDDIKKLIESEDNEAEALSLDRSLSHNVVIGNNSLALKVANETAKRLGYKVILVGNDVKGEASLVAKHWTDVALNYQFSEEELEKFKGVCWLGGGETTVNMTHSKIGTGGRCQEMGLAFYRKVYGQKSSEKLFFLCGGTDGQDGPTDAAGVIAESVDNCEDSTGAFAQSDIDLRDHNSHEFFARYYGNWLIRTGITGTNVMDVYCMVRSFSK